MPIITIFGATGCQGARPTLHRTETPPISNQARLWSTLLADGNYTPRAVSRNPESPAAKELRARGVEVVAGNLFDKESLKEAMRGSNAVFGVCHLVSSRASPLTVMRTGHKFLGPRNLLQIARYEQNFVASVYERLEIYPTNLKGSGEILQGQNLVKVAKAVGVKVFIWRYGPPLFRALVTVYNYSSLPNATKESKGLFPNVYHLDSTHFIFSTSYHGPSSCSHR
jgi:hypothetical protein